MPKREIVLEEMYDGDPERISLVTAGANRAPFKVIKSEDGKQGGSTVSLHFKEVFKSIEVQPIELAAVAVAEGTDQDIAKEAIKAAGLSVENPSEVEGATVYLQGAVGELIADESTTIRLSDKVAVILTNVPETVQKQFAPFPPSENFDENAQTQGFFPGVEIALDAFRSTSLEVLFNADKKEDAVAKIAEATGALAEHINAMTTSLPEAVFKLENELRLKFAGPGTSPGPDQNRQPDLTGGEESAKAGGGANATSSKDKSKAAQDVEAAKVALAEAEEALVQAASDGDKDEDEKDKKGKKGKPAFLNKGDEPQTAQVAKTDDILAGFKGLIDGLGESLGAKIGEVQAGQTALTRRVEKAEQTAKDADAAASGTVTTGANADDDRVPVQRGDGTDPPLMDTGMAAFAARGVAQA